MKPVLVFLCLSFASSFVFAQSANFIFARPKIISIDSIEKVNNGEKFESSIKFTVGKDYFPNADKFNLANPSIFFRKGKAMNLEMNYYYSLPDSIIRLVSYSWNGNAKLTEELNSLFESNSDEFTKYFGTKGEEKNEKHDTWDQKSLTWQNDTVYVHQFLVSSKTTNRVRVLISWR